MPAVFTHAALLAPPVQGEARPPRLPAGQAAVPSTSPSGAAPLGAGAPMATGAVLRPTGLMPIPAPPPVVSTSQAGALAAAALNGLNREPLVRDRDRERDTPPARSPRPTLGARGEASAPIGLPGGPAPAAQGGTVRRAAEGYAALR